MWVEISKGKYDQLQKKLKEMGIDVEISDCTTKEDVERMIHIEFPQLSNEQKIIIQKQIDSIYGKGDTASKFYTNDFDGNGIPDTIDAEIEKEEAKVNQSVERKASDDHLVTITEAFSDFTKGDDDYEPIV